MATENRVKACPDWFSNRFRPLALTGVLRAYLAAHYSDPQSVEEIRMLGKEGDPVAVDGPAHTDEPSAYLTIESITRWRPDSTDKRPAIIIRREDIRTERLGVGNELLGGPVSPTGAKYYSILVVGTHTLFCIARSGAAAELIGGEVFREMQGFARDIQDKLGLLRFGVASMGKLFKLEEPKEHYVTPVTVMYAFEHTWQRVPAAPTLKTITFKSAMP